jgi:Flp pilus assembly protein TadD
MLHAKRYELAVRSLHEVLELRPRMPEAHVNIGYALAGLGEYAAARDFFLSAAELRPSQYNAYYGLAIANEGLNELVSAVRAMRTFIHLAPTDDPFRRRAESAIWEWEAELAGKKKQ